MPSPVETRILFVGDMHLGRLPTSLPEGMSAADLGPRRAWELVVDTAIARQVHCVALAGDLVNQDNAMFEAYGLLDHGIRRLTKEGIGVCAVAGNHDTEVLPQLADRIEDFHLLGPGGSWTTYTITGGPGPPVRLAGWSFPASHHKSSPLADGPPAPEPGLVTLGLLHADLDQSRSSYAPVSRAELAGCGYHGWFLGHVHLPGPVPTDGAPFYLGSLTPLRSSEGGAHGPVLVTVTGAGKISGRRLDLAPLRWEELPVDCSDLTAPGDQLQGRILDQARTGSARLLDETDRVQALGFRVILEGRVAQPRRLDQAAAKLSPGDLRLSRGGREIFVGKIINRTAGAHDLQALAREDHPAGQLARLILTLESGPASERQTLVHMGRRELETVDGLDAFAQLPGTLEDEDLEDGFLDDEGVAKIMLTVARRALDDLLDGREDDHAPV